MFIARVFLANIFDLQLLKMGYAVMYVQMAAPLKVAENYKAKITVSNRSVQYSNTIRVIY